MSNVHDDSPYGKMDRVSADRPCPVCGRPDWCLVAPDGAAAICARVESPKRCGDAGWLHRLVEPDRPAPDPKPTFGPGRDWAAEAARFAAALTPDLRDKLAGVLRLPAEALDALPLVGFDPGGPCATFPEVDAAGAVVGILRRFKGGLKKAMAGGRRGLAVPDGWRDRPGPVFVVEGPTDVLSMTAAGLSCVGRPSNSGGTKLLAGLLADLTKDREVVVVGENDEKGGEWPGKAGAERRPSPSGWPRGSAGRCRSPSRRPGRRTCGTG